MCIRDRYKKVENGGIAANTTAGFALATGTYIALLDGKSAHVGIQGSVALPVVQNDIVSIAENAVVVTACLLYTSVLDA